MSWVNFRLRKPTEGDCDPVGRVFVRTKTGGLDIVIRGAIQPYHVAWMPIPEFTPLPDPPAGYRLIDPATELFNSKAMWYSENSSEWQPTLNAESYGLGVIYAVPIKPPEPQYRPFANAEEFKPYRNRWWRPKDSDRLMPPSSYSETNFASCDWQHAFESLEFECGHPFGVKIHD